MNGQTEDEIISLAAAAEANLKHPIARAIQGTAKQRGLCVPETEHARYQVGFGVGIRLKGREILVGSKRFLAQEHIEVPAELALLTEDSYQSGFSVVFVTQDRQVLGAIELRALVRSEAKSTITQLRGLGVRNISVVSGDHEAPTQSLAASLATDGYFTQVLPEEKAAIVERLQSEGRKVCFVGDGTSYSAAVLLKNVAFIFGLGNVVRPVARAKGSLTRSAKYSA